MNDESGGKLQSPRRHVLKPQEWELDVVLRTQLASFPVTWNLGNSVLPVDRILGVV